MNACLCEGLEGETVYFLLLEIQHDAQYGEIVI